MYENVMVLKKMANTLYDLDYPIDSNLYPQILNIVSGFDDLFYDTKTVTPETHKLFDNALTFCAFVNRHLSAISLSRLVYKILGKTKSIDYSQDVYERYSKFFDSEVRERIAADSKVSLEILETLKTDNAYYVRSAAVDTIRRIMRNSN